MNNFLVTGGAGFIGSNLVLALQARYPDSQIVVIDDFRSGDFSRLNGFAGDLVAANLARLDLNERFGETAFDAVFHQASVTDTRVDDQFALIHDNVEGFRRVLDYAELRRVPVVYASSASVYGIGQTQAIEEGTPPEPANAYAFSKVQLDNLARIRSYRSPEWRVVGVRCFNAYGPGESHKGPMASMIYQLYRQMIAGRRPRIFPDGEQRRDFVFIEDVVALTIQALQAPESRVYNCGSGESISFNEIIAVLNESLGVSLASEFIDNPYPFFQPYTEADLTLSRLQLGYEPAWSPQRGIREYVKRLQNQG